MNINTIHDNYPDNVRLVRSISAKRDRLTWQFIPWREIFSNYDVVFVDGNPRNVSHAVIASALRVCGKRVVLSTMAHSQSANPLTERLRLFWSRMFNTILVYNDAEVEYLRERGFRKNFLLGRNNGLDQKIIDQAILQWPEDRLKRWRIANGIDDRMLILSCARLESKNRFDQVVQILPEVRSRVPNLLWCIIGSGSEEKKLKSLVDIAGLAESVRFVGESYSESELAPWFLSSELLVHPGGIGLSIMHAFGYGLPVVTHGNAAFHSAEYAAFQAGLNGRNFEMGNLRDFAHTVIDLLHDNDSRKTMRDYAQKIAREKYNVDVMVERFSLIAKRAASG